MPSKELTHEVATFLRNISVSSENGGSFSGYECKEKAEELFSTIRAAIADADTAMLQAAQDAWLADPCRKSSTLWRAMLAASALGEQSDG